MKIGEFILKHMNRRKISQAELARRTGIPASTISSIIIRNNDRVAIEMILKICEVLDCDIDEYIDSLKSDKPQKMPDSFTKKYYALDQFGQNTVNAVLNSEYERCASTSENQNDKSRIDVTYAKIYADEGGIITRETPADLPKISDFFDD